MINPKHEEHIQHSFDAYCKKVLKITARECYAAASRLRDCEVSLSQLSDTDLANLAVMDRYFTEEFVFTVLGENIDVADNELGEALSLLPADKRDIVLMSYFFDMKDREIAERLNMARRTVTYKRTSSLKELRKVIESEG